jgi:hypothetical protein
MVRPGVHRCELGVLAPPSIDPRLTSVCVCLVSVGPLGPGFFRIVPTGLHFPYAFRGSLLGSFEPRRRPWGRVLPASAAPSSLHLRPDGVQGVAYVGINGVIRGACGSLERSCFGIEVQGWNSRFSFQSCRVEMMNEIKRGKDRKWNGISSKENVSARICKGGLYSKRQPKVDGARSRES